MPAPLRAATCALLMCAAGSADASVGKEPLPTKEYFAEYGSLYDHVGMLQDHVRMGAYYDAIRLNAARHFRGKVVLDVGAGTGVLSIWAAQAGAKRVYAVEATAVAAHAERMAAAHGFGDVITVLKGRMEELELPEKVDVLLSEWMGYFLLRESMVSSVLYARDKWLKPLTGVMYPSEARLLLAPMAEKGFVDAREADVAGSMATWDQLTASLSGRYQLNLNALREEYLDENVEYSFRNAWQGALPQDAAVGEAATLLDIDMHTVTSDELFGWSREITLPPTDGLFAAGGQIDDYSFNEPIHMLCGWFDVRFCAGGDGGGDAGSSSGGEGKCVELSTGPYSPHTHWAHTTFVLDPPMIGRILTVGLKQSTKSHHDLNVTLSYDEGGATPAAASYAITAEFKTGERGTEATSEDGGGDGDGGEEGWEEE